MNNCKLIFSSNNFDIVSLFNMWTCCSRSVFVDSDERKQETIFNCVDFKWYWQPSHTAQFYRLIFSGWWSVHTVYLTECNVLYCMKKNIHNFWCELRFRISWRHKLYIFFFMELTISSLHCAIRSINCTSKHNQRWWIEYTYVQASFHKVHSFRLKC